MKVLITPPRLNTITCVCTYGKPEALLTNICGCYLLLLSEKSSKLTRNGQLDKVLSVNRSDDKLAVFGVVVNAKYTLV